MLNFPVNLLFEPCWDRLSPHGTLQRRSNSQPNLQFSKALATLFDMPENFVVALYQKFVADIGVHIPPDYFAAAPTEINDIHVLCSFCRTGQRLVQ